MKKFAIVLFVVGLLGGFALAERPSHGRPVERKTPERSVRSHGFFRGGVDTFRGLELTEDQKTKIAAIRKATAEKVKKLMEVSKAEVLAVLTAEQKKKIEDAKKGMEARRAEFIKRMKEMKEKKEGERKGTERRGPGRGRGGRSEGHGREHRKS